MGVVFNGTYFAKHLICQFQMHAVPKNNVQCQA